MSIAIWSAARSPKTSAAATSRPRRRSIRQQRVARDRAGEIAVRHRRARRRASKRFVSSMPQSRSRFIMRDGTLCAPGTTVAEMRGRAAALLTAERTALNFMQRLSGIATLTRQFVDAAAGRITVLDTRKTTPLMRGAGEVRRARRWRHESPLRARRRHPDQGQPHPSRRRRREAVPRMRAANLDLPIEVEAQSLCEVDAALEAGADIVLLDNLSTRRHHRGCGRSAAARREPKSPAASRWRDCRNWRRRALTSSRSARSRTRRRPPT